MHGTLAQLTRGLLDEQPSTPLHIPPHRIAAAITRASQLTTAVAFVLRAGLLLLMARALVGSQPGHWFVGVPLLAALCGLVGAWRGWWQPRSLTALDVIGYAFFVSLTGGSASPFLLGCVVLVPIAALHDGVRGAVTAACLNLIAVLLSGVFELPGIAPGLAPAMVGLFVMGAGSAWAAAMVERLVRFVCTGIQDGGVAVPSTPAVDQPWVGDLEQLVRITDAYQLLRAAKQVARTLAGCPVDIQVGAVQLTGVGENALRLVCDAAGVVAVVTIHRPAHTIPAAVTAQLRLIGHIVARHGEPPLQVVDARDVTVDTALLSGTAPMMPALLARDTAPDHTAAPSSWDTLDIPGLETTTPDDLETAIPTTPLSQAMVTAVLSETTPKRRSRATSDSGQLNLWI